MNKYELFCMIFFALDADWDETKDSTIGEYLSSANPFLFEDIGYEGVKIDNVDHKYSSFHGHIFASGLTRLSFHNI